jgi:chemotaxis signal transduction protein
MPLEILIFLLDQQHYALPTAIVYELARAVEIISVPDKPKQVEGIIEYRGKILPVLDLRQYLRLQPRQPRPTDHLIILRDANRMCAIRVDRALDVQTVDAPNYDEASHNHDGTTVVHIQDSKVILPNLVHLMSVAKDAGHSGNADPHQAP